MATEPLADTLLEQLQRVNEQLASLGPEDLAGIEKAVVLRGQVVLCVGQRLRDRAAPELTSCYRAALEEALQAGDAAVSQLLSIRQGLSAQNHRFSQVQKATPANRPGLFCDM